MKKLFRVLKNKKAEKKKISFAKNSDKGKRSQKIYETKSNTSDNIFTEDKKITHITQKVARKLKPSSWIADTGALSHITNKFNLFSGHLTRMKRRTIKIKGGELYTDQMRTIVLSSRKGRSIEIKRIYYVSSLKANLLSYRRLCMLELKGRFDIDSIYLYTNKKDVLKADHKEGVYVLI